MENTRNGKSSKNQITQQLINISRVDDGEISNLFTITTFDTKQKIMLQDSHKDLWLKTDFPILKEVVSKLQKSTDQIDLAALYSKVVGYDIEITDHDMILSDNEDEDDEINVNNVIQISDLSDDKHTREACCKFKTKVRRRKSVLHVKSTAKAKKTKVAKNKDDRRKEFEQMQQISSRMLLLENFIVALNKTLTYSTTNNVMNEDLIKELITSVVGEKVKDLQEQSKKSNLQSNREIKNVN